MAARAALSRAAGGIIFFLFTHLAATPASAASAASAAPGKGPDGLGVHAEVRYDITVRINPAARKLEGHTVITANTSEELTLMLGRRFEVMRARVDDSSLGPAATSGNLRGWRILGERSEEHRLNSSHPSIS